VPTEVIDRASKGTTVPTYQYACTACGHRFEAVQAFSDASLSECPECAGRLRKLFGSVGVVFKGSGFYRTDSRAEANGKAKSSASASGGDSGSSSSASSSTTSTTPASSPKSGSSDSGGKSSSSSGATAAAS
jgi:putative FmdB family regulatory protein